jgi:hypothetical protein
VLLPGFPSFLLLFSKDGKRNNGLDESILRSNAMTLTEIPFSIMTVVGVAVLTWVAGRSISQSVSHQLRFFDS